MLNKFTHIILLLSLLLLLGCISETEQVLVPNIEGLTLKEAQQKLTLIELSMEVKEKVYTGDIVDSKVLSQYPKGHLLARKGSVVYVVVGVGRQRIEIPSLIGYTYLEAVIILKSQGLILRELLWREDEKKAYGVVIEQSPPAGALAFSGDGVTVTLSHGKWVIVPNLIGLKVGEAEKVLVESGLILGIVTPEEYYKDKEVIITEQFPTVGNRVPEKSMVHFKVRKE